ncbi:MAG: beta-hydroxyacyl-ACP dehydratase [Spirochaetales bacterium]|nr:MAG: beta-hydroxyacyl-ACP dehydratase [Spirochaetales bacterium]
MDIEALLKSYRKKPLFAEADLPVKAGMNQNDICRIIPHRKSFLLLDSITGFDIKEGLIACRRHLDPADPVFEGHFPGTPIYPGVLQIEMIGQAGLCLHYFVTNNRETLAADAAPVMLRATKILGALYLEPLLPGMEAVILGRKLSFDSYFATIIGQVIADGKVCAVAVGEVVFP